MKNIHMFGISPLNGVKKSFFRPEKWHGFAACSNSDRHTIRYTTLVSSADLIHIPWIVSYRIGRTMIKQMKTCWQFVWDVLGSSHSPPSKKSFPANATQAAPQTAQVAAG